MKRGIAGSAVFTIYDRKPLLGFQEESTYVGKSTEIDVAANEAPMAPHEYAALAYAGVSIRNVAYADQIPPFDITLTAANDFGQLSIMRLYGVDFLNEGAGLSVDDIVNETQMTFVCRYISSWRPVALAGSLSASGLGNIDVNTTTPLGTAQFVPIGNANTGTYYTPSAEALRWPGATIGTSLDSG